MTSFNDCAAIAPRSRRRHAPHPLRVRAARRARCRSSGTSRRFPYVPADPRGPGPALLRGLQHPGARPDASGLQAPGSRRLVIGVSGGLDSTQALIVAAKAMDRLGLPRKNILAYTMPGFATSRLTLTQACALMQALGRHRRGNRHSSGLPADVPGYRPSLCRGRAGVRHDLRERAGRRAHLAPVPRWPTCTRRWCWARATCRETGARLDDLRRRRPHVALQRECLGAEDAHPVSDPLGGAAGAVRRRDHRGCWRRSSTRRFRRSWCRHEAAHGQLAEERQSGRTSCRTSTSTISAGTASARARSPSSPSTPGATGSGATGRTCCRRRSAIEYDLATIKKWLEVFLLSLLRDQPVQALGHAERPEGRLGRLALAARRLARAQRRRGRRVARGAEAERAGLA